jgi:hypothetical protein
LKSTKSSPEFWPSITCFKKKKNEYQPKKNNWVNTNQSDLKLGEYLNVVGTMHAEFMVFAGEQCSTWFFFHPTDSKLCIQMNHQYVNKALSECAAVHLAGREVSTHQQD